VIFFGNASKCVEIRIINGKIMKFHFASTDVAKQLIADIKQTEARVGISAIDGNK